MQTNELKQQITDSLSQLRTVADEIRVRIHLAGMDARDAWERLEPRLERAAAQAGEASREVLADLGKELRTLRASLEGEKKEPPKGCCEH